MNGKEHWTKMRIILTIACAVMFVLIAGLIGLSLLQYTGTGSSGEYEGQFMDLMDQLDLQERDAADIVDEYKALDGDYELIGNTVEHIYAYGTPDGPFYAEKYVFPGAADAQQLYKWILYRWEDCNTGELSGNDFSEGLTSKNGYFGLRVSVSDHTVYCFRSDADPENIAEAEKLFAPFIG